MVYEKLDADQLDKMVQTIYELETSLKENSFDPVADQKQAVIKDMLECMSACLRYKTVLYLKEAEEKTRETRLV